MPGPGTAEPDFGANIFRFRLDNVVVLSPPPDPSAIIQAGQDLKLRVDLGFDGHPLFLWLIAGKQYSVFHHLEREEDGARTLLPGGTFTVPTPPNSTNFSVETGPYTSGAPGSGTQFEVPAGFDAGTFEVLTHLHFEDPNIKRFIAAFHQLYVMVTT